MLKKLKSILQSLRMVWHCLALNSDPLGGHSKRFEQSITASPVKDLGLVTIIFVVLDVNVRYRTATSCAFFQTATKVSF
jgi:hypothetical protein